MYGLREDIWEKILNKVMLKLLYKLLGGLERRLWKLPQSCDCRSGTWEGEQLIALANPDPRLPQLEAHNNNSPLFGGGWCALGGIAVIEIRAYAVFFAN